MGGMTDDAAEKNPLGYSFFVFSVLMEDWFRCEPDHVRYVSYLSTEYGEDKPIPDDVREEWNGAVKARNHLRRRIQEHSNAIMFFGDQQGIDMTALNRFMRAVEDRCEFSEVNEQEVHDCFEKSHLRHLSLRQGVPEHRLAHLTARQREAYRIIKEDGPIIGKQIAKRLHVSPATLRRHILPSLKSLGLANDRGGEGYYISRR